MSDYTDLQRIIDDAWTQRSELTPETQGPVRKAVNDALSLLDSGAARVAAPTREDGKLTHWTVHHWLK